MANKTKANSTLVKHNRQRGTVSVVQKPSESNDSDGSVGREALLAQTLPKLQKKTIKKNAKKRNIVNAGWQVECIAQEQCSPGSVVQESSESNDSAVGKGTVLAQTLPKLQKKTKQNKRDILKAELQEECIAEEPFSQSLYTKKEKEEPFDIDQLRNPLEEDEHWKLRLAFLEKNQHVLPPDELVCLAQVYMNIALLRCTYPPETMEQVNKLAAGIGSEYHHKRAYMLKRTFVSASDAAACKVRRDDPASIMAKPDNPVVSNVSSDNIPTHILNCLCSDLVILNDMRHTIEMFNKVNQDGLRMEANVHAYGNELNEAYVKVGGVIIANIHHSNKKLAMRMVLDKAKDLLSQHCYTLKCKKNATMVEGIEVISKSETDQNDLEEGKLDSGNIGFKLMAKLGWTGGSLGTRGDGIMNPVTVEQKFGRKGLGEISAGKLNRVAIRKKLQDFRDGNLADHCIVFSNEYSKEERKQIHAVANQLGLRSQSHGSEKSSNRQLVVSRKPLRPSELLRKIMVDKDPTFCEMYEVTAPAEHS